MRVIKPMALGVLSRPFEFRRQFSLGIAVLAFMPMTDEPKLLAETAMWGFLSENLPKDTPVDAGIPKRYGEFLLAGAAHAPGGQKVTSLRVGAQLGGLTKTLHVLGDRFWDGNAASPPAPFSTMPITWDRAYGGPSEPANPLGMGADMRGASPSAPAILPNISYGASGARPAGFGAIDLTWLQRVSLAGTHGDLWLKEDFPGFARDIDWRFFNTAPADQQFDGALTGTESYAFENLHPERKLITGRLPGIAPRAFISRKGVAGIEEVPLNLTTVWFFPNQLRMVLVHHGAVQAAEEDASDIEHLLAGADPADQKRSAGAFAEVMALRLEKGTAGAVRALDDGLLVPRDWVVPDPALEAQKQALGGDDIVLGRIRPTLERQHAEARAKLVAKGLDPDKHLPALPPEEKTPSLEELPEFVKKKQDEAAAAQAAKDEKRAAQEKKMQEKGIDVAAEKAKAEKKPKGPPSFSAAGMRAKLEQDAAALRAKGILPALIDQTLADPETAEMWETAQTALREAYRRMAHKQDKADPASAARSEEVKSWITGKAAPPPGADVYDLHGVDLAWQNMAGKTLANICLDGANLLAANLSRARLGKSVLAHANLQLCRFDGADLTEASLGAATAPAASFRGAKIQRAILADADLREAVFEDADLEGADLTGANLAKATLNNARAPGLTLIKMQLQGLQAIKTIFDKSTFIEVDFSGADFSLASFAGVSFIGCNFTGVNFSHANLAKACFVENCIIEAAQFSGANLAGANFRASRMANCEFTRAVLTGADFSGADMTGALLGRVNATGGRFTAANLVGASLNHGNFMEADLARADLRGADLTDGGFTGANLARVKLDQATKRQNLQATRMRYLPFHNAQ
jgi:uncharacterized protein YjbI with pentapeptide repeats